MYTFSLVSFLLMDREREREEEEVEERERRKEKGERRGAPPQNSE